MLAYALAFVVPERIAADRTHSLPAATTPQGVCGTLNCDTGSLLVRVR